MEYESPATQKREQTVSILFGGTWPSTFSPILAPKEGVESNVWYSLVPCG